VRACKSQVCGILLAGMLSLSGVAFSQATNTTPSTTPQLPSADYWKGWCDGKAADATATQEGYESWRVVLGLDPPPVAPASAPAPTVTPPASAATPPVQATVTPKTPVTASSVQSLGQTMATSHHSTPPPVVTPPPTPAPLTVGIHEFLEALAITVQQYVVLPEPSVTYSAQYKVYVICPDGAVFPE
jgi:hypothetical protein